MCNLVDGNKADMVAMQSLAIDHSFGGVLQMKVGGVKVTGAVGEFLIQYGNGHCKLSPWCLANDFLDGLFLS